ncbi:lysophospholipid acyltransferase family protein [Patulibacter minatonensis]|uniref:lysophospholipid acyltransferase family protein n=1 Tax=Patulibacter minatonensis TaxID=298163 RepID=UPI001FE03561|nr:lysophospholipid acyltransferase family protein [Patulibacter minatonensis]
MAAADVPPTATRTERMTPMYALVMAIAGGVVKHWGRLEVAGTEHLPLEGPVLLIGNHDSNWDPVAIGKAGESRRQIRALAKSTLWKTKPLAFVMNGMGQIPVRRGQGDAHALDTAITELASGACIGVFPEGTISRGAYLRPRSGAGRLAQAVPAATVVSVSVTGTVDLVRFPLRPTIRVEFFPPRDGQLAAGEEPGAFMVRVVEEIRERAPIAIPGRRKTAAKYRRAQEERAAEEAGKTRVEGAPATDEDLETATG